MSMSPSDQDFRRDKRVTFTTRTALGTVSGTEGLFEDASTIDLSESGVRLCICGQIMPGQVVELFLRKRPEQCRVVWTSSTGASKELIAGLEFICPLPDPRRRESPPSSRFEPIN
jgi:hypothetical protein